MLKELPSGHAQEPNENAANKRLPQMVGRFEIKARLGAGAFGTVYRAWDPILEREVALKIPQTATIEDSNTRARFLREAKSAGQLHHPHIVPIYDTGADGDRLYIASAFIAGRTLAQATDGNRLDFKQASEILVKLADALHYAHEQGIVHRDVKPANVMLDVKSEPHLMDFGLAAWEESQEKLTIDGSVMGTPAYMSPEQAGEPGLVVGPASDQYSAGAMLYELLTGQRPFGGPLASLLFQIRNQEPPSLRSIDSRIPRDLETICLKTLAKHPAQRYASCRALADDLKRWLNDEPIEARRVTPVERLVRWIRREPWIAGSAVVAGLALLAVAIISIVSAAMLANLTNRERDARIASEQSAEAAKQNEQRARAEAQRADAEAEKAHGFLYFAEMNLAGHAWDEKQTARVLELLDSQRPNPGQSDLRSFDWYYLWHQCHQFEPTTPLPSNYILATRFNGDDRPLVVTGPPTRSSGGSIDIWESRSGKKRPLEVWDIVTGNKIASLQQSPTLHHPEDVTIAPDGKTVALAAFEGGPTIAEWRGVVGLWDLSSGSARIIRPDVTREINRIWYSPDGSTLVMLTDQDTVNGRLRLWDLRLDRERVNLEVRAHNLVISADGTKLATVFGGSIHVLDAATGDSLMTVAWSRSSTAMAFGPNSDTLAAISRDAQGKDQITIWKIDLIEPAVNIPCGVIDDLAFSPAGDLLVGASAGSIKVWSVADGSEQAVLYGHSQKPNRVTFSPNSSRFISASMDEVRVWDARRVVTEEQNSTLQLDGQIETIGFASNPERLVAVNERTIFNWNMAIMESRTVALPDDIPTEGRNVGQEFVEICPSTGLVAIGRARSVWLIDSASGQTRRISRENGGWHKAAFSPDGTTIALGPAEEFLPPGVLPMGAGPTRKMPVELWNVTNAQRQNTVGNSPASPLAYAPDGSSLVVESYARERAFVELRHATTGQVIELLDTPELPEIAYAPDGKWLVAWSPETNSRSVSIYDGRTGKALHRFTTYGATSCLAVAPDGKVVAVGDGHDILLWDLATGKLRTTLKGHAVPVGHLAFSPKGNMLVSASADGMVRIWRTASSGLPNPN